MVTAAPEFVNGKREEISNVTAGQVLACGGIAAIIGFPFTVTTVVKLIFVHPAAFVTITA